MGIFRGVKLAQAPAITQLLFADDNFLFFKANSDEETVVKALLNDYELHSSQSVNFQKLGVLLSTNVIRDR